MRWFVVLTRGALADQVYLNNSTDYSDTFLQNEPSPLHTTTIAEHATRKLVDEFEYLRQNGKAASLASTHAC